MRGVPKSIACATSQERLLRLVRKAGIALRPGAGDEIHRRCNAAHRLAEIIDKGRVGLKRGIRSHRLLRYQRCNGGSRGMKSLSFPTLLLPELTRRQSATSFEEASKIGRILITQPIRNLF